MTTETVRDMYLNDSVERAQWRSFVQRQGIERVDDGVAELDQTIGLFDDGDRLVGTGSFAGNVIKFVAIESSGSVPGSRFNKVFGELVERLLVRGVSHYFVFTKPRYVPSFEHVGCTCLAQVQSGAVLEGGMPTMADYLNSIERPQQDDERIGAVVMHADPFTEGHRYLAKQAALTCDEVYVFVVHGGPGMFSSADRLRLVQQGLADLNNVTVEDGGGYIIGFSLFPAYFLTGEQDAVEYQTLLDATLFKNWLVPWLSITDRYVGQEPYSKVSATYNQALLQVLAPQVSVHVVPRLRSGGRPISASRVRSLIRHRSGELAEQLVPPSTQRFLRQAGP